MAQKYEDPPDPDPDPKHWKKFFKNWKFDWEINVGEPEASPVEPRGLEEVHVHRVRREVHGEQVTEDTHEEAHGRAPLRLWYLSEKLCTR